MLNGNIDKAEQTTKFEFKQQKIYNTLTHNKIV